MACSKTGGTRRIARINQKSRTIVGRDRLKWRYADKRLSLHQGNDKNPLATIEPDPKHSGMYRIRFPAGGLSDMVNLTRAKDAAIALALQSLNSGVQETDPQGASVRKEQVKVGNDGDSLCEAANGFLAEGRS